MSEYPRMVNIFRNASPGGAVALIRQDVGAEETYWLCRMVGGGRYHTHALHNDFAGPIQFFQLFESQMRLITASHPADSEGVTFEGAGWYDTNKAEAYLGKYRTSGTGTGGYVEWMTPPGTTAIGLRWVRTVGRGFALVEIDGDPTLADELPTAAELVTAGALDASALKENGGTLNHDDRLHDQAGATHYDQQTLFARNLRPGAHTVRLTVTGYYNPSANGTRISLSAFLYGGPGVEFDSPGVVSFDEGLNITVPTTHEFASMLRSTVEGATSVWVGGSHGNERMAGPLVMKVDGEPVALLNGQTATGSVVEIIRNTEFLHPDIGGGGVATVAVRTVYTLSSGGLNLRMRLEFALPMRLGTTYACMLSVPNRLSRCSNVGLKQDFDCDKNDGAALASAKSDQLWVWEPGGHAGALVWIPDVEKSMDDYRATERGIWLNDRTVDNKIYPTRRDIGYEDIPAGTVLELEGWFIWAWFDNTDAALFKRADVQKMDLQPLIPSSIANDEKVQAIASALLGEHTNQDIEAASVLRYTIETGDPSSELLNRVARELGQDDWDPALELVTKRERLLTAFDYQRLKGTPVGVAQALERIGFPGAVVFEPRNIKAFLLRHALYRFDEFGVDEQPLDQFEEGTVFAIDETLGHHTFRIVIPASTLPLTAAQRKAIVEAVERSQRFSCELIRIDVTNGDTIETFENGIWS